MPTVDEQIAAMENRLEALSAEHRKVEEIRIEAAAQHKALAHEMSDLQQSIEISRKYNRYVDVQKLAPDGVESGEDVGVPGT